MRKMQSLMILLAFMPMLVENSILMDANQIVLPEYKAILPDHIYQRLVILYKNKDMLMMDKLKELNDLWMSLPEATLERLPIPRAFRKLPVDVQQRIRNIYYSKQIPFEEKLNRLDEILGSLPQDQLKLIPIQIELPSLIEYHVSVLMHFNGYFETERLRKFLPQDLFDALVTILINRQIPEATRAQLVGKLLKEAYDRNSTHFPLPMGDDNGTIPDSFKKAGLHLMFAKNPLDNTEPYEPLIEELVSLRERQKPQLMPNENLINFMALEEEQPIDRTLFEAVDHQKSIAKSEKWQQIDHFMSKVKGDVEI